MITCLIIEDEDLAARRLARLIKECDQSFDVSMRCQSVREAIEVLKTTSFDLLFLDIHLDDGLSFDIFEQVDSKTPIIFTTAYDQYAIKAFKQNSIDYLLKPIQKSDLSLSIEKYKSLNITKHKPQIADYDALAKALARNQRDYKERFMVQIADKIRTVDQSEIHYFYADNKTTYLISQSGKRYYVNYTLSELEKILNPKYFFRVNRKTILRIDSIIEVLTYSRSKLKIVLKNDPGFDVFVPAERLTSFKNWLN